MGGCIDCLGHYQQKKTKRGFEDMMDFWSKGIGKYCRYYKVGSFTVDELKEGFTRKGLQPMDLEKVVGELRKRGSSLFVESVWEERGRNE